MKLAKKIATFIIQSDLSESQRYVVYSLSGYMRFYSITVVVNALLHNCSWNTYLSKYQSIPLAINV